MASSKEYVLFPLLRKFIRSSITVTRPPLEHQKSSQIVQLPDDVLFIISGHLTLTDRARLLQTCRYFRSLLEATQYRHIRTTSWWLYNRSDRLHRTLSERPDLIRCIVSYCGPLTAVTSTPSTNRVQSHLRRSAAPPRLWNDTPVTKTEAIRRAIYIFTNAVNLRELTFLNTDDWVSNPTWEPLRTSLSKMPLTRLALQITSKPAEVVPVLRALPGLKSLELSRVPARLEDLNAGDIPKLESLAATLQDAATIIPGRPVGEFCHVIGGELPMDEQLVRRLSLSSSPITKLTNDLRCRAHDAVRRTLQVFARHLPEIQHLTFIVGGVVPGQILLDEIPSFQSIRSVRFLDANLLLVRGQIHSASRVLIDSDANTGDGIARQTPVAEDWDVLVQRLRIRCPLLVDIEHTPNHCY